MISYLEAAAMKKKTTTSFQACKLLETKKECAMKLSQDLAVLLTVESVWQATW